MAALATVCAIVVISGRVASAETANLKPPPAMADKLRPATFVDAAFVTPFFNAKKEPLTLYELKGRGLVVNFWATWCAPCVKEMPALDALAEKLKARGVDLITISEDRKALDQVPAFYERLNIQHLPLYYDVRGQLSRQLGVVGLPTTVLIAASGEPVGEIKGVIDWDSAPVEDYLVERLSVQ